VTLVGMGERVGYVPACLIHDHDGVLIRGECLGEAVEECLHGWRRQVWQHEREALPRGGPHGGEQV